MSVGTGRLKVCPSSIIYVGQINKTKKVKMSHREQLANPTTTLVKKLYYNLLTTKGSKRKNNTKRKLVKIVKIKSYNL